MNLKPLIPTNQSLLAGIPAPCPQCGSQAVSWSPTRVWCTMCSFQTATRDGDTARHTIYRWNRAVRDGIGYYELVRENIEREERKRREREAKDHEESLKSLFA